MTIGTRPGAGAHVRPAGRRLAAATRWSTPGARLGPAAARCARGAGIATVLVARRRGPPCWQPAPSFAARASCSSPARSTRRTGDSSRSSGRQAPTPSGSRSVADDEDAHRDAVARGSSWTCSSPPAACRSGPTTSSAASRPASASRRSSGVSRSSPASRSRLACAAPARLRATGNPVLARPSA